jgi:hypothetical protein
MSCPNCFSGHLNQGTPTGREEVIFGRNAYIAEPKSGTAAKGIIVIIPDAFGWQFVNNRILADHYAARGDFKVYLPDFMDGELELRLRSWLILIVRLTRQCCAAMAARSDRQSL